MLKLLWWYTDYLPSFMSHHQQLQLHLRYTHKYTHPWGCYCVVSLTYIIPYLTAHDFYSCLAVCQASSPGYAQPMFSSLFIYGPFLTTALFHSFSIRKQIITSCIHSQSLHISYKAILETYCSLCAEDCSTRLSAFLMCPRPQVQSPASLCVCMCIKPCKKYIYMLLLVDNSRDTLDYLKADGLNHLQVLFTRQRL